MTKNIQIIYFYDVFLTKINSKRYIKMLVVENRATQETF